MKKEFHDWSVSCLPMTRFTILKNGGDTMKQQRGLIVV